MHTSYTLSYCWFSYPPSLPQPPSREGITLTPSHSWFPSPPFPPQPPSRKGITLDKIFGPLRAADRAVAAGGGGGSVVQPAVKAAKSYAISTKVIMVI